MTLHALFVCALVAWLPNGLQKEAVAPANLSGAWALNRSASDPAPTGLGPEDGAPGDRMGGGRPGGHGPGGGFGGSGMGGGMPGGRGGPDTQPDPEEMKRQRELVREMAEALTRLVIDQDGPTITITDAEGHVRRYAATGKAEKHQLVSGTVETKTRWEGTALVIEMKGPRGFKVKRHFALAGAGDTRQLIVTSEIDGGGAGGLGRKRPPLRAVYEPASQEDGP